MFNKLLLFSTIVIIAFSSCTKKSEDPVPATKVNTNGSYLPSTKGSYWIYSGSQNYSVSMTGNTVNVDGLPFYETISIQDKDSMSAVYSSVYKMGNKYYSVIPEHNISLKLIDLDLPIGTTWETKVPTTTYSYTTYLFKVLGAAPSRIVNGKTYSDVICIELTTGYEYTQSYINMLKASGTPQFYINQIIASANATKVTQNTFYALNVGMIEQTSSYNSLNVYLKEYSIK
jgi:hypothetical protein